MSLLRRFPRSGFSESLRSFFTIWSSQRRESCPQARAFVAKARQLGSSAEVLPIAKSHGEINADLGSDPAYTASVERFLSNLSPALAERLR